MATPATLSATTQLDTGNYQGVSVRSSSVLTTSYVYTDYMDVRLFEAIDWVISLTAQGSITRLDIQLQFAMTTVPVEGDFATMQAESIDTSGNATITDYTLQKTISTIITLGVSVPVRGRFMRMGIKAGVGAVAGSLCQISALRRKPRTA